jgi:hypothetical protein
MLHILSVVAAVACASSRGRPTSRTGAGAHGEPGGRAAEERWEEPGWGAGGGVAAARLQAPPAPAGWPVQNWTTIPTYIFCGPVSRFFTEQELQIFAKSTPRGYRPRWVMLGYATLSNFSLRPGLEPAGNNQEKQALVAQHVKAAAPDMPVFGSTSFDDTLCGQATGRRTVPPTGYCSMEIDTVMVDDPAHTMLMHCNGSLVRRTGCSPATPGAVTPYYCTKPSADNRTIHNWTNPATRALYAGMYRNWSQNAGITGGFLDGPKWAWPVFADWPFAGGCSMDQVKQFFHDTETAIRDVRDALGWDKMLLCNDGSGLGTWEFETQPAAGRNTRHGGEKGSPMCSGANFEFMQGKLHDVLAIRQYARTRPNGDGSFAAIRGLHTTQSHHGVVTFGKNASMFARTINGFLAAAGPNHYFHWFANYGCDSPNDHLKDIPEYSKPLGDPVKTVLHSVAVYTNGSRVPVDDCACARAGSLLSGFMHGRTSPPPPDWPPSPLPPGLGGDGRPITGGVIGLAGDGGELAACECVLAREFASGTKTFYNGTSWRLSNCTAANDKRQCGAGRCSDQSCDEACNCVAISTGSCTLWADGTQTESSGCSSSSNPGTSSSWRLCPASDYRPGCEDAVEFFEKPRRAAAAKHRHISPQERSLGRKPAKTDDAGVRRKPARGQRRADEGETEEAHFFEELESRLALVQPPEVKDDLRVANRGLHVMTMYGGTPDQLHAVSANVVRGGIDYCENKTITEDWKMRVLVHLPSGVFIKHTQTGLRPQWQNITDAFIAEVRPHVASGKALGVFMGDEVVCGGVQYSALSMVSARLKAGLPDALIYVNECTEVQSWPELSCRNNSRTGTQRCTGGVPAGLDAISIDLYDRHNTDGAREVESIKVFYHRHMYPKMYPHQRALFVPGVFALDPVRCKAANSSCPLAEQARQVVTKLQSYFDWAKNDSRIIGFNPWHFCNRSDEHSLGAIAMPTVVAKLHEIGNFISNQSSSDDSH